MNKQIAVVVGILVVGMLAWWRLRGSESTAPTPAASPTPAKTRPEAGDSASAEGDTVVKQTPGPRPRLEVDDKSEPSYRPPITTYVRSDGTVVRDHRMTGDPIDIKKSYPKPRAASRVQPATVAAVRRSIRPAMAPCVAAAREKGMDGAVAQLEVQISIQEDQVRVDEATMNNRGIPNDGEFADCVQKAVLGHELTVPGSGNVKGQVLTFPYTL